MDFPRDFRSGGVDFWLIHSSSFSIVGDWAWKLAICLAGNNSTRHRMQVPRPKKAQTEKKKENEHMQAHTSVHERGHTHTHVLKKENTSKHTRTQSRGTHKHTQALNRKQTHEHATRLQKHTQAHTKIIQTHAYTHGRASARAMTVQQKVHTSIRIASMPAPCGACNSLSWSKNQLCFWFSTWLQAFIARGKRRT